MTKPELIKLARELNAVHGLMPVPVAGKVPLGGTGWNLLPLATRLAYVSSEACTGVGIQFGLVWHPVLGPLEARGLDCDINNVMQRNTFAATLQSLLPVNSWRWGRRPATLVFTEPGIIKHEKFGPVQLLGSGKQAVWWGQYHNKVPDPADPIEYWHEGKSLFEVNPPMIRADALQHALEASVTAAGFPITKSMLVDAQPLSARDIAMLTPDNLAAFSAEIKSMLIDVEHSPTGSGRGTKLHHLGVKYGALIKASGHAPMLMDAMRQVCEVVEFDTVDQPLLMDIGLIAESAFMTLPGSLGHGDKRDFARGVGASMGLGQSIAVERAKHPLILPTGRDHPGQTATELRRENLAPIAYLVDRYLADVGCMILAGKPKVGKGWIVLELGLGVAEGGKFWGQHCQQGEVLMYMLEDGKRRVKQRLDMLRPGSFEAGNRLRFRYSIDGPFYINSDGKGSMLDDIREHLRCFPLIRLVVIDVLQRIRGTTERSDNAYQADYKVVGALQKLSAEHNILIVVVHHTKKGKVDDAIDAISGSFGLIGAADGGIVIGREGDKVLAKSSMRDIQNYEFELVKEENSPMWKPAQTVAELMAPSEGTKTQSVLHALHAAACVLTAGDISKRTNIPENQVAAYLGRLMKNNQVIRPSRGYYMAAGLPYRDRIEGVVDVLKKCPKTPATTDIKNRYAPNSAPPDAMFMMHTDQAIREIEGGFVNGKNALQALKFRGMLIYNTDTIWLMGDEWEEPQHQPKHPNPFAMRMPWEAAF